MPPPSSEHLVDPSADDDDVDRPLALLIESTWRLVKLDSRARPELALDLVSRRHHHDGLADGPPVVNRPDHEHAFPAVDEDGTQIPFTHTSGQTEHSARALSASSISQVWPLHSKTRAARSSRLASGSTPAKRSPADQGGEMPQPLLALGLRSAAWVAHGCSHVPRYPGARHLRPATDHEWVTSSSLANGGRIRARAVHARLIPRTRPGS